MPFPAARRLLALAIWLALGLSPPPARPADGPRVLEGVHEGAAYRIEVPAGWNGGLVMFAHAYQREGPGAGAVQSEPLEAHLSERGYAWAAAGYRSLGYRPDWFIDDVGALRERLRSARPGGAVACLWNATGSRR
ncbi:MAG: hypothetical protein E6K82_15470 [Candidatus Rokuibacteriota bacterium]|nr:MAG: hypothetical protein E6K82_15470 [Candidatus Rokubacteria bacterium]